jgi:hypothetical protein
MDSSAERYEHHAEEQEEAALLIVLVGEKTVPADYSGYQSSYRTYSSAYGSADRSPGNRFAGLHGRSWCIPRQIRRLRFTSGYAFSFYIGKVQELPDVVLNQGPCNALGNATNRIQDGGVVEKWRCAEGEANEPTHKSDTKKCAFLRSETQNHARKGAECTHKNAKRDGFQILLPTTTSRVRLNLATPSRSGKEVR